MACVTLITDFGYADAYVGAMKGALLRVDPTLTLVDISHAVGPQDIAQAGRLLASIVPYYPAGTVHVVVVDPGVGSQRRILAAEVAGSFVVAPDNGCLGPLMDRQTLTRGVCVENRRFFNPLVSATFHGRDIMGPVAAHLSLGVPLGELGPKLALGSLVRLPLPVVVIESGGLCGVVVAEDRFGNLITNIHREDLEGLTVGRHGVDLHTTLAAHCIVGLSTHYGVVDPGKPLALVGSDGYLEIAVNGGHAARQLNLDVGIKVRVNLCATDAAS